METIFWAEVNWFFSSFASISIPSFRLTQLCKYSGCFVVISQSNYHLKNMNRMTKSKHAALQMYPTIFSELSCQKLLKMGSHFIFESIFGMHLCPFHPKFIWNLNGSITWLGTQQQCTEPPSTLEIYLKVW